MQTQDDEEFTGERAFKITVEDEEQILDQAQVTITDNETPQVEYSLSSTEANAGSTARVAINRSGDTEGSTSVTATSVNGSLVAGTDFEELNQTVSFEAGETNKQISINLTSDNTGSFSVELSTGESATVNVVVAESTGGDTSGGSMGLISFLIILIIPFIRLLGLNNDTVAK
ncbi:Calx-beta domain-containing protein [Idiomarina sp. HP20-50]|nr:Calx-beta domain-containing protein [Idiomarina sp. HP20-50]MDV6315196.1 Calx-beta domain-containing protein [Idiomarina sp. HP20-50]